MPTLTSARTPPTAAPISLALELALVAAGGVVGALARAALTTRTGPLLEIVPLSTQVVNAFGALLLGFLLAILEHGRPRPKLRPFLAVGALGSFTTFSSLVQEAQAIATTHSPQLALAFLALSIAAGLLAFGLGQWLGRGPGKAHGRGLGPDDAGRRRASDQSTR